MNVRAMISLAEDAGFADFQDGLKDGRELRAAGPASDQMSLDVLDLDDRRVDDHPDTDRQPAEGHQVGRKTGQMRIMMNVNSIERGRARMTMKAPRKLRRNR